MSGDVGRGPERRRAIGDHGGRGAYALAAVLVVALVAGFGATFVPHPSVVASGDGPAVQPVDPNQAQKNWEHYGNTAGGSRFAALDQIHEVAVAGIEPSLREPAPA